MVQSSQNAGGSPDLVKRGQRGFTAPTDPITRGFRNGREAPAGVRWPDALPRAIAQAGCRAPAGKLG